MKLQSTLQVQTALYQFTTEGGAVGTVIKTGVIIPKNASVSLIVINSINTPFAGGGAPTMDMGISPIGIVAPDNLTAFFAAQDPTLWLQGTTSYVFPVNYFAMLYAGEVVLNINAAPLLAGKFTISVYYVEQRLG